MIAGISGAPVASNRLYASIINDVCVRLNFPPRLAYAVAMNETIIGEMNGKWNACTIVSFDGGHGLFQLTSSWPDDWADPVANTEYAVKNFLRDAFDTFVTRVSGDDLVRCVAAAFNAGLGAAVAAHARGDVDRCTTDRYGERALENYHALAEA